MVTGEGRNTLDSATHVLKVTCSRSRAHHGVGGGGVLRAPLIERKTSRVLFQGRGETCRLAQPAVPTVWLTTPTSPEHPVLATSCLPDGT